MTTKVCSLCYPVPEEKSFKEQQEISTTKKPKLLVHRHLLRPHLRPPLGQAHRGATSGVIVISLTH